MLLDLERIDGLFEGLLDEGEQWLFEKAIEDGLAQRSYEGGAGFMGLAKVRLIRRVAFPKAMEPS